MGKLGFILLHRQIQEHWLYPADRPFSEYEAWLHLLQMAAHTPHQKFINGKQITIGRGEIALSERRIAEMFQWGRKRASRFVEMLEKDGMIRTTEWATKWARLSINNYEAFQVKNGNSGPQREPQTGPQVTPLTTPQGIPQTFWNQAQGEAEEGTINKGINKGKEYSSTTAKAAVGEVKKSKANKQTISPEARQIVRYLSDSLKQRGGREGQFDQSWAFAGFNAAEKLLKNFTVQELEAAIDYLLDHKYHGTGITSMSAVAGKILVWQREAGVPATGQLDVFEDPLSRGCK